MLCRCSLVAPGRRPRQGLPLQERVVVTLVLRVRDQDDDVPGGDTLTGDQVDDARHDLGELGVA